MFFSKKKPETAIWLNIDIPTKKCTIHSSCGFSDNKSETNYKGILELKRDGGWLKFKSKEEAKEYQRRNYSTYSMIEHC